MKKFRIIQNPIGYLCNVCGDTSPKKVRKSETLPLGVKPTLDDVDTFIEVGCCSKCGRDIYPIYTKPYRIIQPNTLVKLSYDESNETYFVKND